MEVAARAGLSVEGVGLPGHFVVRVLIPEHGVLIDPFHQGALLSDKDCQERLDRIFGGKVKVDSSMLESAGPREMLERILRNLKDIYVKERDHKRALRTVDLLLELAPAETDDLRDRGILYAALDCYGLAVRDLEAYLAQVPGASDAEELQARLVPLRQKAKRLN
jgi:regulator of sirC expression with transglutaminase-like and TPR domain